MIASTSITTQNIGATSYNISISVSPKSGGKGTSFTVTATVEISDMKSGTAYVILKTRAPDGSRAYYANSAWPEDQGGVPPHRQWIASDMPVSQTYTWTVTADQAGDYVSSITIVIDGDAPGGHLEDSKSATFTATSGDGGGNGGDKGGGGNAWIDVTVSPSSVQQGSSITITVEAGGYMSPNPQIVTSVYPPDSNFPVKTFYGEGTFTYNLPPDAQTWTWTLEGVIKDDSGNPYARDKASFSVTSSCGGSDGESGSWIIRDVSPQIPYVGQKVRVKVRYNYDGNKEARVVLQAFGKEIMYYYNRNEETFEITPNQSGTFTINVKLQEKRWNPVFGKKWSTLASTAT